MDAPTLPVAIHRFGPTDGEDVTDVVAVEEPLEIRLGDKPLSVTMRTPGDDFALTAGFLAGESVIRRSADIASIRHWGSPNVVRVTLADGVRFNLQSLQRHFYSTSSCGICGKTSVDAIRVQAVPLQSDERWSFQALSAMPDRVRREQKHFAVTGGIHAAGLFSADGTLAGVREDVGRHNAVDKIIGALLLDGTPLRGMALCVSGRAGFEIVQKAAVAGIGAVIAVGAPSSLAVELARGLNMILAGFVRDGRLNVYSGQERMAKDPECGVHGAALY